MNYSELVAQIQDIAEDSFTTDQVDMFIKQAEQKAYQAAQFPAMRKNATGACTASDRYMESPTDMLWIFSFAVIDADGKYHYMLNKDTNFILEAYPDPTVDGMPKHYAQFSDEYFIFGPTPDANYTLELHYAHMPESIVTATNTWLGDNFDSVLLNGALVEAARFQKSDPDTIANYDNLYNQALSLFKNSIDGKMRQDAYRSGQLRAPIK